MDWFSLFFLIPLILVPIVLLCGFAGCAQLAGLGETKEAVAPAAPSGLTGTATDMEEIKLSWNDNAGGHAIFSIERASPLIGFREIGLRLETNFTDNKQTDFVVKGLVEGLVEGTTYLYQVRAKVSLDAFGGDPCKAIRVTTFPATPTNLVATAIDASHVQLSWSNASATADKFSLEHRPSPGSRWTEIHNGPEKTWPPTGSPGVRITPGGNDEFQVTAIVSLGYANDIKGEVRSNPSAPIRARFG